MIKKILKLIRITTWAVLLGNTESRKEVQTKFITPVRTLREQA